MRLIGAIGHYGIRTLRRSSDFLALLSVLFRARFYVAHGSRRRIFYRLYNRHWLLGGKPAAKPPYSRSIHPVSGELPTPLESGDSGKLE